MTIRAFRVLVTGVVTACFVLAVRAETPRVEPVTALPPLVPLPVSVGGRVLTIHATDGQGFGADEYESQWPGTYFETAFEGREIYFRVAKGHEILHVVVDGAAPMVLVNPKSGAYAISGLAQGRHRVSVQVATESQDGAVSFGGFAVAKGGKAIRLKESPRQIEFIGDSHTVGYGNTSTTRECSTEAVWATTDDTRSFGRLTATHYGADYQVNAISGRGVVRNYNGFAADTLPEAYPYVLFDKKQEYSDANWKPEVVVIALGTNDFSTALNPGERWKTRNELHADYEKTYVGFIQRLRAKNPGAYIVLWATDKAGGEIESEVEKVEQQAKAAGETRIGVVLIDHLAFTGCHSHPSLADDETISRRLEGVIDAQVGIWQGK